MKSIEFTNGFSDGTTFIRKRNRKQSEFLKFPFQKVKKKKKFLNSLNISV